MSRVAHRFNFVDFKNICINCKDNCCTRFYAVLLDEEEEDFKDASFEIETERGVVKCIGSRGKSPCPYLSEEGYCTVYDRRPLDCRLWPILVYIDFKTRERVIYLDLECPAVREGKVPTDLVEKIVETLKSVNLDERWLEKYTLAPWPNNFIEVLRFRPEKRLVEAEHRAKC